MNLRPQQGRTLQSYIESELNKHFVNRKLKAKIAMKKLPILILAGLLISFVTPAQKSKAKPEAQAASKFDADKFKAVKWRNIGPFRGGRANTISGVVGNDNASFRIILIEHQPRRTKLENVLY